MVMVLVPECEVFSTSRAICNMVSEINVLAGECFNLLGIYKFCISNILFEFEPNDTNSISKAYK